MTTAQTLADPSLLYPSPLKEFWRAFAHNKGAVAGLLFILLIIFCALFAPWRSEERRVGKECRL